MDRLTLDRLDRRLVHALRIDGRAPFSRIAAVLGVPDRTLARRYRRLRSAGEIRVVGWPEPRALGQVEWLVRIGCQPSAVSALAAALARRPDTTWVSLTSGGTEVTCITRAQARQDPDHLLLQQLPRSPRVTVTGAHCLLRTVAGDHGWPGMPDGLTSAEVERLRPVAGGIGPAPVTDADRRLLPVLAADGRAGYPELARATGWSESTVRRRLEELRRTGVLRFHLDIDPLLFGGTAEAMLWLTVTPGAVTGVSRALSRHPEIAFAAATTGPANMVGYLACRDTDALYDYLADRIGALPGVLRVETAPIVHHAKRSGALLMPVAGPPVPPRRNHPNG